MKRKPSPTSRSSTIPAEDLTYWIPRASKHRQHAFLFDWWFWKTCGLGLSIASVVAILTICANLDTKPSASWYFSIALNSLVSFFAVISKAALLLPVPGCISQLRWLCFKTQPRSLSDLEAFCYCWALDPQCRRRVPTELFRTYNRVRLDGSIRTPSTEAGLWRVGQQYNFHRQFLRLFQHRHVSGLSFLDFKH